MPDPTEAPLAPHHSCHGLSMHFVYSVVVSCGFPAATGRRKSHLEENGIERCLQTSGIHSPGWLCQSGTELLLGGTREVLGARQLPSDTSMMSEPLQLQSRCFMDFLHSIRYFLTRYSSLFLLLLDTRCRSTPFYLPSSRPGRSLQLWTNPAPSWTEFTEKM